MGDVRIISSDDILRIVLECRILAVDGLRSHIKAFPQGVFIEDCNLVPRTPEHIRSGKIGPGLVIINLLNRSIDLHHIDILLCRHELFMLTAGHKRHQRQYHITI